MPKPLRLSVNVAQALGVECESGDKMVRAVRPTVKCLSLTQPYSTPDGRATLITGDSLTVLKTLAAMVTRPRRGEPW